MGNFTRRGYDTFLERSVGDVSAEKNKKMMLFSQRKHCNVVAGMGMEHSFTGSAFHRLGLPSDKRALQPSK